MGGHGGLNILPQKKWNVYNRDNREIVERDEQRAREREGERDEREAVARMGLTYAVLKTKEGVEGHTIDTLDLRYQDDDRLKKEKKDKDAQAEVTAQNEAHLKLNDITLGDMFKQNKLQGRWYRMPPANFVDDLIAKDKLDLASKKDKKERKIKKDKKDKKEKKSKKHNKKHNIHTSRSRSRSNEKPGKKDTIIDIEQLRKERKAREAKERERALNLLRTGVEKLSFK